MDEPVSFEATVPTDKYVGAPCVECKRETRHRVSAETKAHFMYAEGPNGVDVWLRHQILQCQGCMTESFCREYRCSEEWDVESETGQEFLPVTRTFYPSPASGRSEMQKGHCLPAGVAAIYRETVAAFAAQLPISAGFGLRAIIEAVCIDKSIQGRNLEERIDGLQSSGLITPAAATILHSLRFMGNAAAHEMKAHSTEEIANALDIVEILLQNVYVLPQLAKAVPKSG